MTSRANFMGRGRLPLALLLAAGLLAACGGSDDNGGGGSGTTPTPPVTAQVPASASTSVLGFITYLQQLVVSFADRLEPVDTSSVTGPTDETSEPIKVD